MHERPTLHAGEEGLVDLLGDLLIVGHDEAAARPAEGLVRRRRHNVRVGKGRGMGAGRAQPGDVGNVGHEDRPALVGDGSELREVDRARVGRVAAEDHPGPVFEADGPHRVVVDVLEARMALFVHQRIMDGLEVAAGEVDLHAVAEVPAVFEHQRGEGVADLHHGHEDGHVRLGAAVGLDVGECAAEELLRPLACEVFDLVVKLAPAVVACAGVALGVLVGEAGAHRVHHARRDVILGGDEFERGLLAPCFGADDLRRLWIVRGESGEKGGGKVVHGGSSR